MKLHDPAQAGVDARNAREDARVPNNRRSSLPASKTPAHAAPARREATGRRRDVEPQSRSMPPRRRRSSGGCSARRLRREAPAASRGATPPVNHPRRTSGASARERATVQVQGLEAVPAAGRWATVGASTKPRAARTLDFEQAMATRTCLPVHLILARRRLSGNHLEAAGRREISAERSASSSKQQSRPDQAPMETEETTGAKFELGPSSSRRRRRIDAAHRGASTRTRAMPTTKLGGDERRRLRDGGQALYVLFECRAARMVAGREGSGNRGARGRCSASTTTRSTTATRLWNWSPVPRRSTTGRRGCDALRPVRRGAAELRARAECFYAIGGRPARSSMKGAEGRSRRR